MEYGGYMPGTVTTQFPFYARHPTARPVPLARGLHLNKTEQNRTSQIGAEIPLRPYPPCRKADKMRQARTVFASSSASLFAIRLLASLDPPTPSLNIPCILT